MHILLFAAYYFVFLLGFAAQVFVQAQASVASCSNSLTGLRDWLKVHAVELMPRFLGAFGLAPVMVSMVPDTGKLPVSAAYFLGGFFSDRMLSAFFFIYGQKLGVKVDTPQVAPPNGNGKNGSH
jgi:hypothetical protein